MVASDMKPTTSQALPADFLRGFCQAPSGIRRASGALSSRLAKPGSPEQVGRICAGLCLRRRSFSLRTCNCDSGVSDVADPVGFFGPIPDVSGGVSATAPPWPRGCSGRWHAGECRFAVIIVLVGVRAALEIRDRHYYGCFAAKHGLNGPVRISSW